MTQPKSITNAEVKQSIDQLSHRFDLFELKWDQLRCDVEKIDHEVFGNSKEGMKSQLKTLWDAYCKKERRSDAIWIGIVMILITQVLSLILK